MNEMETASLNMAITEKKGQSHRPGGCVGILFQLFDWNRRFAKKKLFSKKLLPLPSARTKQQASKKYGGDEKMPKTKSHLIEDENNGGFPNLKKNGSRGGGGDIKDQKLKMESPSLVARLMGLEALPAAPDKFKKGASIVACDVKEEKFDDGGNVFVREDMNLEKRNFKVESRPQKLQKTGQSDRRAITRFGAEGLQIKSILSRSRKPHHHPKLLSPVKSPRISNSSRNSSRTSRLIDVAARMLEPGLQATSKAKCALTYSMSTNYGSKYEVSTDEMNIMSPDTIKQQYHQTRYNADIHKPSLGQNSCRNCGNLLDAVDYRPNEDEQPSVSTSSATNSVHSSRESEYVKPRAPAFHPEYEGDVSSKKNLNKLFFAAEKREDDTVIVDTIADNGPPTLESQEQLPLIKQQCRLRRNESPSSSFKHGSQTQTEFSVGSDRTPPRGKSNNLQSRRASSAASAITRNKDFVALNKSLSGKARPRMSPNVYKSTIDSEGRFCSRLDDSMSQLRNPACKKRIVGWTTQAEKSAFVSSTPMKQRNTKNVGVSGRELRFVDCSIDRPFIKERSISLKRGSAAIGKDRGVVSSTIHSPLRNENLMCSNHNVNQIDKKHPYQKRLLLDENDGQNALHKQFPLREGALGALLEQKLKELTSEEAHDLTNGSNLSKKSTAMILQELLLALTSEQPISPSGHTFQAHKPFQADGKMEGNDIDHLSPGSVLETSFSNDSCFSSSLDDNIGCRVVPDMVDNSYDSPQRLETEVEIWDPASFGNGGRLASMIITDLLNYVSRILQGINLAGVALMGSKLAHAKDVILNAELLFRNSSAGISDQTEGLIGAFLLDDDFENFSGAVWPNLSSLLGFEKTKESNRLRRFLFDCAIEFLDSKCSRYSNAGFKARRRLLNGMNSKMLIREVGEEVRRWMSLAGMIPDEIIEWEMSHDLGKWTDFEIETFEAGAEIGCDILQRLVEEVVVDLGECNLTF